jgi:hypothetical protein
LYLIKKEILSEVKSSKAFIKEFNKDREVDIKYFYNINSSWFTIGEDLVKMQKNALNFKIR